ATGKRGAAAGRRRRPPGRRPHAGRLRLSFRPYRPPRHLAAAARPLSPLRRAPGRSRRRGTVPLRRPGRLRAGRPPCPTPDKEMTICTADTRRTAARAFGRARTLAVMLGLAALFGHSAAATAESAAPQLSPELATVRDLLAKYKDPVAAVRDGYFSTL